MKNVRKNLTLSLLLVFLLIGGKLTIEAQSVLSAGDIAFLGLYTGGSAGNGDAFTFITLKELSPGTIIYFTDEGWNNGAWGGSPSEGHFTWSPPAGGTPIGTIVTITGGANQSVPGTPSVGTCSSSFLSGTTWHFPTGEEIIAYQSTSGARPASPTFIAGMLVYYNSNFYNSSTKWCTSIPDGYTELASTLPNGLINGTNSISVCNSSYPTTARNCRYNGLLAGTASTVRALINNDANWTRSSTNPFDITSSAFSSPAVTADPLAPSATTNAATSVTTSGAMLNGNINANGSSTTVTFEYGLTASYGLTVTATQSPVSGSVSTAVSKALTGLSSNTTYHYRVKCTNAGGTTYGTDQTFTTLSAAPTAEVPSGTGTSSDPYLISNLYELYWIAEQISLNVSNGEYFIGKYFKQTANIDASATSTWFGGKGWLPIGYFDEATNNYEDFGGNYDGQGFTVSNIYINRPTETNAGLFGSVTNGVVRNLGVTNLSIQANNQTGGLIGYLYGTNTIENCYTTGTISCSGEYVAGLVGFNDGTNTINSCYSECNVTGASYVAGIYSQCSSPGSVTSNCHSSGTITSTALNGTAGGLIAYAYGTVRNCYSSANVVSSNGYCGGLIQINYSTVSNCYATGSVNGKTYSGGFVGTNGDSYTITNCYSTGSVTASNSSGTSIGGFAGVNIGTITNCYTTSSINSVAANTGGFVGDNFISVKSVINNSFWNSDVYTNGFGRNVGVFSALGKTTSQMKTTSTFTTPGWDFSGETTNGTNDYWGRADDKNSGYPYLTWQYPSAPEINITGNNITIVDGDVTPSTTDYTDFGSVAVASGTIWREFRIWNTGTSALNLTGSPSIVSSSGEFIVDQPIMSTIDPGGGSITFRVIFDPSASGTRTATLSIANNDADENPYNFSIQGSGSVVAPTVTTQAVSSILSTTATGNGNVTVTGDANVTERGFYYSTTSGFADGTGTKVSTTGDWSTTGAFTQAITGLSTGTTYYIKAFATNAAGTSYGGEVTFTTTTIVSLSGCTGGTTVGQNSPVYIASAANVTGTTLNGAIAFIGSNFNSAQDLLGIDGLQSGTSGSISYSYDSSKGVLTLTGDANVATYQSIIRKITYTNTSASPTTASRSITVSLNKALPYSGNGHFFEFIANSGITWTSAKTAAEGLNYFGLRGYLATITSAAENEFCTSKLSGDGWMGASDVDVEGTWKWVTGPEAGHSFSEYSYSNWNTGQPDNYNGVEDYAQFYTSGKWNDLPNSEPSIAGYVVEFGGSAGDPVLDVSDVVTVNITIPANVTSVSVPSNGTYRGGNILNFNVTFSENINVVTTGGTPYIPITLNTGGTVNAIYVSGSGTTTLLFSYQIVTDNLDLDGITVGSAITANGGTLKNAGGFDANLTLNSVGSTTGVLVDAVAPSVLSVSSTSANAVYKSGDIIAITVSFSEAVTVTGTPTLALNSGGTAYYSSGSGTSILTFRYNIGINQSSADLDYNAISSMYLSGGSIKDAAGNATWLNLPDVGGANSLGGQKNIVIAIKPSVETKNTLSITSTGATINGMVNANNALTHVTFEYGLTDSYGVFVTAVGSPVNLNVLTSVNKSLTGLLPNTTYHYRVIASNTVGTSYGADSVFTTLPASSTTFTGTGNWSEMERWSAGIPGTITATTISGTCTATDNYEVASLLINSGKLTINPDKTLKVTGSFVNNVGANAFILKSDATGTGKLVNNSTGVQATVQQYFVKNQWHYYTTPVSSSVNAFPLLYNLWAVDHDEKSNSWSFMNSANIINTGKGYGARYSSSSGNDTLITITGALNAGNKVIQAKKEGDGWNLIGNPYPSTADWANGILRDNVYNAIYLWNPVTSNYGYFVDGVSVNGQTQYIAPMQGFFVKATAEGSVTFTDATKSITPSYFRNAESQTLIRLQLKSDKNLSDETVIRVKFGATDKFDAEMDANKLISTESGIPQIFTQIALEEYAVNTISQINEGLKVPVKIMLSGAGKYIISISELKDFDSGLPVYMFDTKNRKLINLLNENIEFETNVSETIETYLLFTNTPTSTIEENTHNITVFSKHKSLVVEGMSKSPHEIQVYTLDGVLVFKQSVNTGKIDIPVKSEGIYAVKIIPENGNVFNSKVVVR